jgi:mannose-6-phosphate isomerase
MQAIRFRPEFKSMIWGGQKLKPFFGLPASQETIGEAWVLSDVDGTESIVANGPLAGQSLRELLKTDAKSILGNAKLINGRFPLLLKFIDSKQELSVQVHPNDQQANARKPGQNGKTEAWVVLDANEKTSKMYAGFREGVSEKTFRAAMQNKTVPETMHTFVPKPGDCIFLKAGTVHAIGADTFLFEVQQTSDITYRLYDWDRVDSKTGKSRELHIEEGLACSDFSSGPCKPVTGESGRRTRGDDGESGDELARRTRGDDGESGDELARRTRGDDGRDVLVECDYFNLSHIHTKNNVSVELTGACRIVVCIQGQGTVNGEEIKIGDVILIPALAGKYELKPSGELRILECSLPTK